MSERKRVSKWLPSPIWSFFATAAMIVGVVSLRFGWAIYSQQMAIRAIERVEGSVFLERGCPDWIPRIGDLDSILFDRVTGVDFEDCNLTDFDLKRLKPNLEMLPRLRSMHLDGDSITDAGLSHLTKLDQPETMRITCPHVTRAGIEDLERALPNTWITVGRIQE